VHGMGSQHVLHYCTNKGNFEPQIE